METWPIDEPGAAVDGLIGGSGGLRPVMERVDLVRRSDVPVLLLGETGSGKEMVARAIHSGSARAGAPILRVNCGAIPPELIDSQLFGHERGSFTGAAGQHQGWFERASGGTLFLDEIGELPLAAQVRLLRVLQDGLFERVGGGSTVRVDCRIIAATHRDLPLMVQEGRFREDLWYRIAVFPIVIPPLRERRGDIPELVHYFAARASRFGLPVCEPSPEDMARLVEYPWPGNVRELAAVIDRAAILGEGRRLDITTSLGGLPGSSLAPPSQSSAGAGGTGGFPTLEEAIRSHIERALIVVGGRVDGPQGAAMLLGLNANTLRSKMRKLGISAHEFRASRA